MLGAKLDSQTENFKKVANASGLKTPTMYDVMVEALKSRNQPDAKLEFPKAAARINQYKPGPEYMLQLRQNFLPMMVVSFMTDFKDRGLIGRGKMALGSKKLELDVNSFTKDQLIEWTNWLKAAKQTRKDLREAGIEPQYNTMFMKVLNNIDFGQATLVDTPPAETVGLVKLQVDFAQAWLEVTQEAQAKIVGMGE
jgi:hypothetical protein